MYIIYLASKMKKEQVKNMVLDESSASLLFLLQRRSCFDKKSSTIVGRKGYGNYGLEFGTHWPMGYYL